MTLSFDSDTLLSIFAISLALIGIGWACFGIATLWTLRKFFGDDEYE